MATAAGMMGSCGAASSSSSSLFNHRGSRSTRSTPAGVRCAYGSSNRTPSHTVTALMDQYRTLRIHPGASEREVKKAFRQLALQYHPDVCKGGNCGVQFHRINEAYHNVMNSLRGSNDAGGGFPSSSSSSSTTTYSSASPGWSVPVNDDYDNNDETYDPAYDLWEEWMGFEGGCTASYTSHINPYI